MRIVDEWNKGEIKVTAFHMNGRYSIKFEIDLMEQWYKFRDGQFDKLEDLKQQLDDAFYNKLIGIFKSMSANRRPLVLRSDDNKEFDQII